MYDIISEDKLRGQLKELQGGEGPCQKSWNSLRGKYHNFFARGARIWVICSTEVENSVLYTPRDNSGHNSRTGHDFDLRFSR